MARFLTNRNEKIGTAPGSLVFVGEKRTDKVQLDFLSYDAETIFEKEIEAVDLELAQNYDEVSSRPNFFEEYKAKKAKLDDLMLEWEEVEEKIANF